MSIISKANADRTRLPRQNRRILFIDDDVELLHILKERFENVGYAVDIAANGFQAVMRLNRQPEKYQVVVTDIRMPGLDGYGVIEQARAGGYPGPFVVFAAALSPEHRDRLLELEVRQIIDKPGLSGQLRGAIEEALSAA